MATETGSKVEAYARALVLIVQTEGHADEVEDELFRFARAVEGNDDLRMALSDQSLPAERRMAIVEDILGAKALYTSTAIASFLVGAGRGRELPAIITRFVEMIAETREHVVAEVRSAISLDDQQRERLAVALSTATGKQVEVRVVIDESVMGGILATIGETVIDGTIRHRLEKFKELL
ncbi:MAG: ATP synthase F1 subunit delta [Actinomycetota bacterium]|nr:ATP synthase F1 subunit delta [Actinomycetota bacterium]